ncbi:LacI family transcriptional regulator [Lentzea aerocolonigenes]|uniref:LacI family transcriptional regulator n=1 Tax=Lentzea aerocolonigenes TaxID=68170 RepID=A0A0F0GK34_LENAE|nr:LacI family DNA-binding transcriptional regulator [Lentzea aerocolonigenes]KJK43695.1 LacI family transcriptional regulator [Lentzea aerocolonigenes]
MVRVRMADVAARAGVSTATVSMVLNGVNSTRISPQTQQRVREAAEAVGYKPNSVARSLRTQQTRMVGLISDTIASTPFAGRMLAGANDVAREQGHLVVLVDTERDAEAERQALHALNGQQVDAVIYACMWHRVVEVPPGLPEDAVLLDCAPAGGGRAAVVPDERAGGRVAVRELVAAGHRRIAFLDAEERFELVASRLRYEGYLEVLAEAGIEPDPALHVRAEPVAGGGRDAARRLLDLPERPTAMFCFNDRMAMGAYAAAHHCGLSVPRDLSIVGYDDQQLVAAELDPPLTTIALPHYEMGRWAMEVALGLRQADPEVPHLMPCPLIRRASVSPPPTQFGD